MTYFLMPSHMLNFFSFSPLYIEVYIPIFPVVAFGKPVILKSIDNTLVLGAIDPIWHDSFREWIDLVIVSDFLICSVTALGILEEYCGRSALELTFSHMNNLLSAFRHDSIISFFLKIIADIEIFIFGCFGLGKLFCKNFGVNFMFFHAFEFDNIHFGIGFEWFDFIEWASLVRRSHHRWKRSHVFLGGSIRTILSDFVAIVKRRWFGVRWWVRVSRTLYTLFHHSINKIIPITTLLTRIYPNYFQFSPSPLLPKIFILHKHIHKPLRIHFLKLRSTLAL